MYDKVNCQVYLYADHKETFTEHTDKLRVQWSILPSSESEYVTTVTDTLNYARTEAVLTF